MNIFILDTDIEKCAQFHVDKHVTKMILESAQILSTVNRLNGLDEGYKITHKNHPCVIWAGECSMNWIYLRELARELQKEALYRGFSFHMSSNVIESLSIPNLPYNNGKMTRPRLCMPDKYKCGNITDSYRNYYMGDKRNIAYWRLRGIPDWWL